MRVYCTRFMLIAVEPIAPEKRIMLPINKFKHNGFCSIGHQSKKNLGEGREEIFQKKFFWGI